MAPLLSCHLFPGRKEKQQSGSRYETVGGHGPRRFRVRGSRRGRRVLRRGPGQGGNRRRVHPARQMGRKAVSPEHTGTAESWGDAEGGSNEVYKEEVSSSTRV